MSYFLPPLFFWSGRGLLGRRCGAPEVACRCYAAQVSRALAGRTLLHFLFISLVAPGFFVGGGEPGVRASR